MSKWRVRFLSAVLAVAMLFSNVVSVPALAAGTGSVDGAAELSDEGAEIDDYDKEDKDSVITETDETENAAIPEAADLDEGAEIPENGDNEEQERLIEDEEIKEDIIAQDNETDETGGEGGLNFVSSVYYGLNLDDDLGIKVLWDEEYERYNIIMPDTRDTARIFIDGDAGENDERTYLLYNPDTGKPFNGFTTPKKFSSTSAVTIMPVISKSKPDAGNTVDCEIWVGSNYDSAKKDFNPRLQTVKLHHYVKVTLEALEVKDSTGILFKEEFNSVRYAYEIELKSNQETITLAGTPKTPLASGDKAGTIIQYLDKDNSEISGSSSEDGIVFQVNDLPKDENGNPYIKVRVSYSDLTAETESSEYTMLFVDPEAVWNVEAKSETDITCEQDSEHYLTVAATKGKEEDYQYQWYTTTLYLPSTGEYGQWQSIDGAAKASYMPPTAVAGTYYYRCKVTKNVWGNLVSLDSPVFKVDVSLSRAELPVITRQPENAAVFLGSEAYFGIGVEGMGQYNTLSVQWYQRTDDGDIPVGEEIKTSGGIYDVRYSPDTSREGTFQYYARVYNKILPDKPVYVDSEVITLDVRSIPGVEVLEGDGSEADPYQVKTLDDLLAIKKVVESGYSLEGRYIRMENDLTLPADWEPIGCFQEGHDENTPGSDFNGKYVNPFSAVFDGGGHTLTIEEGGQGLIKYAREATVQNLDILGKDIRGSAVVTKSFCDYGTTGMYDPYGNPWTVKIDHVKLLSGSHTSGSGFLPGSGSGINHVYIMNSTIEEGVTIGNPGDGSGGGFVGSLNGYVTNCVCKATVYGSGGLAGNKGQTMGSCSIKNSAFIGTLISSKCAGGIIGSGYGYIGYRTGNLSAPNTPPVSVQNCYVRADITGSGMVGGIIGGEPALVVCVNHGAICNNSFQGTLTASDPQTDVGGIIGYLRGFDKYQGIENNYYEETCGASQGIGYVQEVIMSDGPNSDKTHGFETAPIIDEICIPSKPGRFLDGTVVGKLNAFDSSLKNWIQGAAGPEFSTVAVPYELKISDNYKREYQLGEELDLSGAVFTLSLTDGSTQTVDYKDIKNEGYDKDVHGMQTVTLSYGGLTCQIQVVVLRPEGKIAIDFVLYGDQRHDSSKDGKVHTLADNNLEKWAEERNYVVSNNATVWDVLQEILKANGMACENPSGNYVESITRNGVTIGEFTNGNNSGWMFTINGVHGRLGVSEQYMDDGDTIIFHYTDDHTKEKAEAGYTAEEVIALIDTLPDVDKLTLNDETAVAKARDAFASLSEEEKAKVPADKQEKLNAAVLKIAELKKAQADSTENIYKTVGNYLAGVLKGNETFGMEWPVIGLVRAGRTSDIDQDAYYASVADTLKKNGSAKLSGTKSTENSRLVLALTALGYDVTDVAGYNLLAPLADLEYVKQQGINGPIWALIAFDSHGYEIPAVTGGGVQVTRVNLIRTILDARLSDGGWALSGSVSDPDITGMALQALAPYYGSNADVKKAVDGAVSRLSTLQNADGSYSSWGTTNAESCVQVIVALTALRINPATDSRFVKNGNSVLDALLSFHVAGSGFKHVAGGEVNGMASEQGYYALAAYFRFLNGQTSLYDMSDVEIRKNTDNKTEDPAAKVYHILKGADGLWTVNADGSVTITADGELADFVRLEIDGKVVDPSNYSLKAGSTIVTLKTEFLKTLGKGDHTVTFVYKDGEVSMTLPLGEGGTAIKKAASGTKTGDENQPEALAAMLLASVACMAAVLYWKRKKELAEK